MKKYIIIIVVFACMLAASLGINIYNGNEIQKLNNLLIAEKDYLFIEDASTTSLYHMENDSLYDYKFKSDDELNWYFIQQFIETADSAELNFHASTNGSVNGELIFKWNH